jgi:hypothetical protein
MSGCAVMALCQESSLRECITECEAAFDEVFGDMYCTDIVTQLYTCVGELSCEEFQQIVDEEPGAPCLELIDPFEECMS